jgi:metal-dependent amidase/aminoacylase/carboxypeptidase family protein
VPAEANVKSAIDYSDVFHAVENTDAGTELVQRFGKRNSPRVDRRYLMLMDAAKGLPLALPMRWSEDFGLILQGCGEGRGVMRKHQGPVDVLFAAGAFFLLGAGDRPGLHTEGYDFNDTLLEPGVASFLALVQARHG